MITSTHITNTEIFASIAVLVFKLLSRKEKTGLWKLLQSRLSFNKKALFTGKLLQNYK